MNRSRTKFPCYVAVLLGTVMISGITYADDTATAKTPAATAEAPAPAPTKHRLMKECMRKEKAAISGRENYDLAADCRDITKTEKQNEDAEKVVAKKPDNKDDKKDD